METLASAPSRCRSLRFYVYWVALPLAGGARLRGFSQSHLLPSPHRSLPPSRSLFHPCLRRLSSFKSCSSCSSDRGHTVSYFASNTIGERNKDRMHHLHHRAALLRPPPTVSVRRVPRNSCSFIGSVTFDPRVCRYPTGRHHSLGVYTVLQVDTARSLPFPAAQRPADTPNDQSLPFSILLLIYDDLAKAALEYLGRDDFIYVCGQLASYKKPDEGGNWYIKHKLHVKDLNFVARSIGSRTAKNMHEDETIHCYGKSDSGKGRDSEDGERIHLWQVFFANPLEWWDNRNRKRYPGEPDFRNKDTNECLTLGPDDPPWVRKQLEQIDFTRMDRDNSNCFSEYLDGGWIESL